MKYTFAYHLFLKADFHVFARSASAVRASEECSIITYRKSTTSFRLVPKSVTLNDLKWQNGRYVAYFFIILNYGPAVFLAIAGFLFSLGRELHTAVARISEHWLSFLVKLTTLTAETPIYS